MQSRKSKAPRLAAAILILGVVGSAFQPTAITAHAQAADRSAASTDATIRLDGVQVLVHAAALPSETFILPDSDSRTQVATSASWHPFRELSITVVPFGRKAGTEALPRSARGGAHGYRLALGNYRAQQGGHPEDGPTATLFGQTVTSLASKVNLFIDGPVKKPVLIREWAVEAGSRIWIVRLSQEQTVDEPGEGSLDFGAGLTLESDTLNEPSTSASPMAVEPVEASAATQTASDLPLPSWWSGDCDYDTYLARGGAPSYRLGAVYLGMPACGPRPWADGAHDVLVRFFSGSWGVLEWECVELSMRFLYLMYNIPPYGANGSQVVWNYSGTRLVKIANGTAGRAPQPNDVLSYGSTSTLGHTSVVTGSNVDSSGNGSITIIEENAAADGDTTLNVSNWVVGGNAGSVSGWLHDDVATALITINGGLMGTYDLPATTSTLYSYAGMQDGPVQVHGSSPMLVSERGTFGPYNTFNEVIGIPNNQLTNHYWFPWYDNVHMITWVLVGNPSVTQAANVTIKIGGVSRGTWSIPPFGNITPTFDGLENGPVEVISDINVFASQRVLMGWPDGAQSFDEVPGFPHGRLAARYWFTWYDNKDMQTAIMIGNPNGSNTATVTIKIAGVAMGSYSVAPRRTIQVTYPGVQNGPVDVKSNINVFATERSTFGTAPYETFNEVAGYANPQLAKDYWFPWYDNQSMIMWVLVGNPSATTTANVTIKIAGATVGAYSIPPFGNVTPTFTGTPAGPVQVTSNIPVFTSERALSGYPGTAPSFNEILGVPTARLTTDYWFTWYDDKDMSTDIVIGRP